MGLLDPTHGDLSVRGFAEETQLVHSALAAAERGIGSVVLVEGGAGCGKSTLLRSAESVAAARGFAVASSVNPLALAEGPPLEPDLPGQLHSRQILGDDIDLLGLRAWLAAGYEPTGGRFDAPVLVAMDDIHELSTSSSAVLATLPVQYANRPVVWIVSRRKGLGEPHVRRLFSLSGNDVTRIHLDPMNRQDTAALIADVAPGSPPNALLALGELAGGNRLLVVELVRGLLDERGIALTGDVDMARLPVPQRLRNAVDVLLCSVSSGCRNMLQLVALAGYRPSLRHIAGLLERPVGGLVSLISEAIDLGVLADSTQGLVFTQELTRRTLISKIPTVVAQQLTEDPALTGHPAGDPPDEFDEPEPNHDVSVGDPREDTESAPAGTARTALAHLTRTQRTIAHLVGEGLTNQQIASRLFLSPHTVSYHLRNIFRRQHIHSRAELATLIQQDH